MIQSIHSPIAGSLNRHVYSSPMNNAFQQNVNRRSVYQRLGLLSTSQIFSQLGIERYSSSSITRILTDILLHKIESHCRFLKELTEHFDVNVDGLWTVFQADKTGRDSENMKHRYPDQAEESTELESDYLDTLFNDEVRNMYYNSLVKCFISMEIGEASLPGFVELKYYLKSQVAWTRSLNNMLINKNIEPSVVMEGSNIKPRFGKKMLPPEALLSLIKTCPISQREKKKEQEKEHRQSVNVLQNKYEGFYREFLVRSSLEDIEDILPPIPIIRETSNIVDTRLCQIIGERTSRIQSQLSSKGEHEDHRHEKSGSNNLKGRVEWEFLETFQNIETNSQIMERFLSDLKDHRSFWVQFQDRPVETAVQNPPIPDGTLLDYELCVPFEFPTSILFSRLEMFEECQQQVSDYFMSYPTDHERSQELDGSENWIFGNPCRLPLFLTYGNSLLRCLLNPRVSAFFRSKGSSDYGHLHHFRLLSHASLSSASLLVSLYEFFNRNKDPPKIVPDIIDDEDQIPKIRLKLGEFSSPRKKLKLSENEKYIPKLKLLLK